MTGAAPCGSYEMDIQKTGYGLYTSENITDINKTYTIYRQPVLSINFSEVGINDVGTTTSEPDGTTTRLNYTKCTTTPATHLVVINATSNRGGRLISNINIATSTAPDCSQSSNCAACREDGDESTCRACAVDCSHGMVYSPFVSVDYVPSAAYDLDIASMDMATGIALGGAFTANYNIPEVDTRISIFVPENRTLASTLDGRISMTADMAAKCNMQPVSAGSQAATINMYGCSCTQLKGMIERELGSCINATTAAAMFQGSGSSWTCARADVIAAIGACGYGVRGC